MGIVRPVMELYPYAWMFFVPFILVATFTMLNLFIGVIVSAMQSFHEADEKAEALRLAEEEGTEASPLFPPTLADVMTELQALRKEIATVRGGFLSAPTIAVSSLPSNAP